MINEYPGFTQTEVLAALERFAPLQVAVVGEVIIDECVSCDAIARVRELVPTWAEGAVRKSAG